MMKTDPSIYAALLAVAITLPFASAPAVAAGSLLSGIRFPDTPERIDGVEDPAIIGVAADLNLQCSQRESVAWNSGSLKSARLVMSSHIISALSPAYIPYDRTALSASAQKANGIAYVLVSGDGAAQIILLWQETRNSLKLSVCGNDTAVSRLSTPLSEKPEPPRFRMDPAPNNPGGNPRTMEVMERQIREQRSKILDMEFKMDELQKKVDKM